MASIYSYTREAVRVKVKKCEPNLPPEWRKFSVDPQITSLDVLYSILAKAFDIKSDFSIKYKAFDPAGNEIYLAVLSDWDLDAAFLRIHNLSIQTSTEPCLILQIDIKPFTEVRDWEAETPPATFGSGAREIMQPIQQSIGMSQKYVQSMQTKLPGLIMNQMEKTFSIVQKAFNMNDEPLSQLPPRPPLSDSEFRMFLDPVGQILRQDELRKVIFLGGIDPSLRRVVWKHILNVYPNGMNGRERMDYMKRKSDYYVKLRDTWKIAVKRGCVDSELSYVTSMVKKDVLRTDRLHPFYAGSDDNQNIASLFNILTTYALNHPSVSYCQGMSDIASPLLVTMNDEAQAYICFCAIMSRVRVNFMLDGIAMTQKFTHLTEALNFYDPEFYEYLKLQQADDLLFCYRWLLLELKREFPFEDALRMLEVQWSSLKYESLTGELALYEKEFEPILPEEPPPASPSYIVAKPRENPYTKICALRRQSSSVSLSSTCSSQNLSTSFTNSPGGRLDGTKRLNQSMDDNISSRSIRKNRNVSKAHQSLDESKMMMLMEHLNENGHKLTSTELRNFDEFRETSVEGETEDVENVHGEYAEEEEEDFVFHPTNPFMEDVGKQNDDDQDVLPSSTIAATTTTNAFLDSTDTASEDGNSEEKRTIPKSIMKLHNKNIFSNYNAVSNIIAKQITSTSGGVQAQTHAQAGKRGGGHFKELKEKIVANKRGGKGIGGSHKLERSKGAAISDDTDTGKANRAQPKLIKNFNEFLNLSSINRTRMMLDKQSSSSQPAGIRTDSSVLNPLLKLSRGISSVEDSDSSTAETWSDTMMAQNSSVSPVPSALKLQLDLKRDFLQEFPQKIENDPNITPDDIQEQEYYPMTTAMTRELRLEMENLDRQVFGPSTVIVEPPPITSDIEYEKLDRDSMDLVEDLKEDEIITCPDINELIVRRRERDARNLDAAQRISTCSSTRSDVFVWENPLHQMSNNSSCNFNEILDPSEASSQPPAVEQYEEEVFQFGTDSTTNTEQLIPLIDSLNPFIEAVSSTTTPEPLVEAQSKCPDLEVEEATTADITFSKGAPTNSNFLPPPSELGGGHPFLIFLCLTLLLQHRTPIMKSGMDYNEIAMHFDKMVRKHDVTRVLNQARCMYIDYIKNQNARTTFSEKEKNNTSSSGTFNSTTS
ncbi:TBC1 domain family member 25 [Eupeodes corollae]|uniref:TBC1 domain family member 25 n=1 Tax=Eupeodes corollae TaxID=290404 RepID=UPI0024929DC6|nr:TBC1 domain family member 25 [Eupeodes corollae]